MARTTRTWRATPRTSPRSDGAEQREGADRSRVAPSPPRPRPTRGIGSRDDRPRRATGAAPRSARGSGPDRRPPGAVRRAAEHHRTATHGAGDEVVPRARRPGALLDRDGRAGRDRRVRRLVPRCGLVRPLAAGRGLRQRAPGVRRADQPPADRRHGAPVHRGGRGERHRRAGRAGRRAGPGGVDPLRPRGRLRHRRDLRAGRGDPRGLGRPARGAGRGLRAARGDRRRGRVPCQCTGLDRVRAASHDGRSGAGRRRAHRSPRTGPDRRRPPDRARARGPLALGDPG